MKKVLVPLIIVVALALLVAVSLYFTGINYPTVGSIAAADCLIPAATPLWAIADRIIIMNVAVSTIILLILHKNKDV